MAIEIPSEIREEIAQILEGYKTKDYPCRWVAPENLHITLIFLGEVFEGFLEATRRKLKEAVQGVKGFSIRLGGFGAFPSVKNPRVFWIGVIEGRKEVEELQGRLVKGLAEIGFEPEARKFHPHLTLGRAKGFVKDLDLFQRDYESGEIFVNSIALFKSTLTPNGPIYEKIEEYRFSG